MKIPPTCTTHLSQVAPVPVLGLLLHKVQSRSPEELAVWRILHNRPQGYQTCTGQPRLETTAQHLSTVSCCYLH